MPENQPVHISAAIEEVLQRVLPPDLAHKRAGLLQRYDEQVQELKDRFTRAYGEIVLHEIEVLYMDGFPREQCLIPAYNNTAMRKREMQEEMIGLMAEYQRQLREGLRRLLDDVEDSGS